MHSKSAATSLALAALVVESLDELTPDAIESAAQRARKSAHLGVTGPKIGIADAAMTVLDAADGLSTSRGRQRSYDRFWQQSRHRDGAEECPLLGE